MDAQQRLKLSLVGQRRGYLGKKCNDQYPGSEQWLCKQQQKWSPSTNDAKRYTRRNPQKKEKQYEWNYNESNEWDTVKETFDVMIDWVIYRRWQQHRQRVRQCIYSCNRPKHISHQHGFFSSRIVKTFTKWPSWPISLFICATCPATEKWNARKTQSNQEFMRSLSKQRVMKTESIDLCVCIRDEGWRGEARKCRLKSAYHCKREEN